MIEPRCFGGEKEQRDKDEDKMDGDKIVEEKWMLLLQPIETRRSAALLPKVVKGLANLGVAM